MGECLLIWLFWGCRRSVFVQALSCLVPRSFANKSPGREGGLPSPECSATRGASCRAKGLAGASCPAVAAEETQAQPSQVMARGPKVVGMGSPAPPGLRVRCRGDWGDRAAATGGPPSRMAAGARGWLLRSSGSVSSAHTRAGFSDFQPVLY